MEFKLPEIGEGVHEGELIRWLVKNGDVVKADQALVEVMTDKATVEVPSPSAGKISGIDTKEGQMIKVGQVIAQIDAAAAQSAAPQAQSTAPQAQAAQTAAAPAAAASPASPAKTPSQPPQSASASPTNGNGHSHAPAASAYRGALEAFDSESVPAAPVVRAMAAQMGVNLKDVQGTGPVVGDRNRVLERDLLGFLGHSTSAQSTSPAAQAVSTGSVQSGRAAIVPAAIGSTSIPGGLEERKPVRGLRRVIAQAMVRSKFTAPHYAYVDKFECSNLVTLRDEVKVLAEKQGVKVTYLAFIVKALVAALKEFPVVNSSLEEGPQGMELVLKKYYNIGIAVSTPDGLVVPVIKNADQKSLIQIAKEMTELSEKTRIGKASPDDLKGSTFTITSMGNVGGLFATPIINYPEVGIMGVYKVVEEPIVKNSQIVIGKTMHLSLSLDHRVVDGAVGAQFCNAVIARLQDPARLFMELV
jgi:pyruvate dehydrogenase E2 component (dihydrolipoamide acetyltransferase)